MRVTLSGVSAVLLSLTVVLANPSFAKDGDVIGNGSRGLANQSILRRLLVRLESTLASPHGYDERHLELLLRISEELEDLRIRQDEFSKAD